MVAYSFQARFSDAVADLRKRQTIRAQGKRRHAKPGDKLQLYVGMRTKDCRKLVDPDPVCTESLPVHIYQNRFAMVGVNALEGEALEVLAKADGFKDYCAMEDWFEENHGLPFHGVLIKWEPQA